MDTAQCIWTSALAVDRNITIDNDKDLFLLRERTVERLLSDNTSINRFVISEAILKCLKLLVENWTENRELYSINTDGFYMTNPRYQYRNKKGVTFKIGHIGKPFCSYTPTTYFERYYQENHDTSNYTDIVGDGCIYHAQPVVEKHGYYVRWLLRPKTPSYYLLPIRPSR